MARKKSIDELDEEMERLEAELRALEEGDIPEDNLFEDEDESSGGILSKLRPGTKDDAEEAEPPSLEDEEAEQDEEAEGNGKLSGLMSKFKRDKAEDPEEGSEAPPEPSSMDQAATDEPSLDEAVTAEDAVADAEETAEEPDEDEGRKLSGFMAKLRRDKDETEREAVDEEPAAPALEDDEAPLEAEAASPPSEEADREDEDEDDDPRFAGLISRFKRDTPEEDEADASDPGEDTPAPPADASEP
ncbi:MAG: hypothetical protein R3185_04155, partial [Candidatus Thermoplasmatota archaeon]|nr:hypothetical protein [Candidatus Thermoplasmatota archaeon]